MAEANQHVEPLHLGLATARTRSLLQPGELTRADNTCYKQGSISLHNAPSRTNYATGLGAAVLGLQYCPFDFLFAQSATTQASDIITPVGGSTFDGVSVGAAVEGVGIPVGTTVAAVTSNTTVQLSAVATVTGETQVKFAADHYLIAMANSTYRKSVIGSGTFQSIETIDAGDTLSAVGYNNKHVLLNGKNDNRVLMSNGLLRAHGLKPVTAAPSVVVGSGGAWANATGYYSYWTTEWDKANDIESDYQGPKPPAVNMSTTTTTATIRRPPRTNTSATHWRLYRSTIMAAATQDAADKEIAFPFGEWVADAELKDDGTQETITDGQTITTSSSLDPTTGTSGKIQKPLVPAVTLAWANPSNAAGTLVNGATATLTYDNTNSFGTQLTYGVPLELSVYDVPTITPPVTGITITIRCRKGSLSAGGALSVRPWSKLFGPLSHQPGSGILNLPPGSDIVQAKTLPITATLTALTVGSSTDSWLQPGFSWTDDMLRNGNFVVQVFGHVRGRTAGVDDLVEVDYVGVTVSYGKPVQGGAQRVFPFLTVKPAGQEFSIGRNGPPPRATTGMILQNSLVTNDVSDGNVAKYSDTDAIDYFPSHYFVPFDDPDDITCMRALGEFGVVMMRGQMHRLSYLPRAVDAEFDRGRCRIPISTDVGCVGAQAACVFTLNDGVQRCAFLHASGPYYTDGYRAVPINPGVAYDELIEPTALSIAHFINNPFRKELLLLYVPKGSGTPTVLTKALRFHYHGSHILPDGSLKVTGPCDVLHRSVAPAVRRSGVQELYGGDGTTGTVYNENVGATADAVVRTRSMALAGTGRDFKYDDLYVNYSQYAFSASSAGNITAGLTLDRVGKAVLTSSNITSATLAYPSDGSVAPRDEKQLKFSFNQSAQMITTQITFGQTGVPMSLDYLTIFSQDQGRENT